MYKSVTGLDEINWERNPICCSLNVIKWGKDKEGHVQIKRSEMICRKRYLPETVISLTELECFTCKDRSSSYTKHVLKRSKRSI